MKNFYYNLAGGLNTESTTVKTGAETNKLFWADALNIEPYKSHGITRQKGNREVIKVPGEHIKGIFEFPKDSKSFIYVTKSGQIGYYNSFESYQKIVFTLSYEIENSVFSPFLDGLILLIPGVEAYYLKNTPQGISAAKIAVTNSSGEEVKPAVVSQFAGRVFFAEKDTLYFSALGTYDDWKTDHDAGYIAKFHSSTGDIIALREYAGSLAIYKSNEVFLLSGTGPDSFTIVKFADKGALGPNSVLTCNNRQYFASTDGVFNLSQIGELSQIVMSSNVAKNVQSIFTDIDRGKKNQSMVLPYEIKNAIWFFLPHEKNDYINEVLIYDFSLDCWYRRVIPYKITTAALVSGRIYTASADGEIFVENAGNSFCSKPVEFKFSSPFFHFSKPSTPKIIDNFNIIFEGVNENAFKFSVSKDYNTDDKTPEEVVRVVSVNSLIWSQADGMDFDNDTVWDTYGWSENVHENIKLDIFDANTAVQLHFEGNEITENLTVLGLEFKEIYFEE